MIKPEVNLEDVSRRRPLTRALHAQGPVGIPRGPYTLNEDRSAQP